MPSFEESSNGIPVLDFEGLGPQSSNGTFQALGKEIESAFRDFGCAYIVNHGIPTDAVAKVMETSGEFFRLPSGVKNSLEKKGYHGYLPFGQQRIMENIELRESFEVRYMNGPFPDEHVPELRPACAALNLHFMKLATMFLKALEFGLDLAENLLVEAHSQTLASPETTRWFRMAHYPPMGPECPPKAMRVDAHTDYTSITFGIQDELGGLEVRNRRGEWVLTNAPQDAAVLVIVGDMLERWTRGKFIATEHRVKIPTSENLRKRTRSSAIFFMIPDDEVTLAPFDGLPSEVPPMTAGEYLVHRHTKTLEY